MRLLFEIIKGFLGNPCPVFEFVFLVCTVHSLHFAWFGDKARIQENLQFWIENPKAQPFKKTESLSNPDLTQAARLRRLLRYEKV